MLYCSGEETAHMSDKQDWNQSSRGSVTLKTSEKLETELRRCQKTYELATKLVPIGEILV